MTGNYTAVTIAFWVLTGTAITAHLTGLTFRLLSDAPQRSTHERVLLVVSAVALAAAVTAGIILETTFHSNVTAYEHAHQTPASTIHWWHAVAQLVP